MFTPRNVALASLAILVLSLLGVCASMLLPPDGHGLREDSYGTRARGGRALFETLGELGISTERELRPPLAATLEKKTLFLWNPQPELVSSDPVFLQRLGPWIETGGRVVAVVSPETPNPLASTDAAEHKKIGIAEALGVEGFALASFTLDGRRISTSLTATNVQQLLDEKIDYKKLTKQFFGLAPDSQNMRLASFPIRGSGAFETLTASLDRVAADPDELSEFRAEESDVNSTEPASAASPRIADHQADVVSGELRLQDPAGQNHLVGLVFQRGQGEIVLLSLPSLAQNLYLSAADNAALLARIAARGGSGVVFDEFYHGLNVRGNPLWLLLRPSYGVIALALLALVGGVLWREAIFLGPPLAAPAAGRRSLAEYLEAMPRFLLKGGDVLPFLVTEARAGIIWTVRTECGLPPEKPNSTEPLGIIARREPERAERLKEVLDALGAMIQSKSKLSDRQVLTQLQRVNPCLFSNITKPSNKKS